MAGGMVEGAVVGAVIQEGVKPIAGLIPWLISKAWKFRSTRRNLASMLERVTPVVKEMKPLDEKLDRPKEENGRLMEDLQRGEKLLSERSKVPWWKWCCLPCYQVKLQATEETVKTSLAVDLPPVIARDVKEVALAVRGIQGKQFKGLCKPPEKPDMTVGLERPLNKLKNELLESGVSVLVLTGLAGSGKSTLATLLCWDEQVRDKFGDNILFVTVSKTPNLKIIVQSLFEHRGWNVPDLDLGDEHTVRQLKSLVVEIGRSPLMLVLDDVWPDSESIVEAFAVQHLSHYKILVTSRVDIPRFGTPCHLKPLCLEDAVSVFRRFALPNDGGRSYIPDENFVKQVARSCWGSPLVLKLIGTSLCGQPQEVWQKKIQLLSKGGSIVDSNAALLHRLQKCLDDALEDKHLIKECFMDLGLFPEDQKIPVAALIDMWTELHKLDDGDIDAMNIVHELTNRHLVNLVVTREVASDVDNYYSHHFLMQHDLVREIAIHQASQEPFEQRKRLIFDINENNWLQQNQQQAIARTLSISTDEMDTPDRCNMLPAEVLEVLVLNLRTTKYSLPEFMEKMGKLKVLTVTNYDGFHFSELNNFEILGSLSSLKRIRLQQVSVPSLGKLNNLRQLSLYMCDTSQAFQSDTIPISDALPNLEELSIDYSKDLVNLPAGICDVTTLKKLSITKCSRFSVLPQEIGNLVNLEMLRVSSCSELGEIPASIGRLGLLDYLDISYCVSLGNLPEEIGGLSNLTKLHMTGCSECKLPSTVTKLEQLRNLICDEETAASWELFKPYLPNLEIKEANVHVHLNWLGVVRS